MWDLPLLQGDPLRSIVRGGPKVLKDVRKSAGDGHKKVEEERARMDTSDSEDVQKNTESGTEPLEGRPEDQCVELEL